MNGWQVARHVAGKELRGNARSWWIDIMGLVCAALSWAVLSFGFSLASGQVGRDTLLVSLVHLQLYIAPLLGLLIAYDAVLAERESGMFEVHMALGAGRWGFLVGKWVGLFVSLLAALTPSLALQAWLFAGAGGRAADFALLLAYGALLGGAVVSLGLLLSSLSLNRGTVIALCLGAWLLLAVLLDFLVIGLLSLTQGHVSATLLDILILLNPLGSYRLLSYSSFFPAQVESLLYAQQSGFAAPLALLALWIVAPVLAAAQYLARSYRPIALGGAGGTS